MSDTMNDIDDVEDVLSSIRRLVSETTTPPADLAKKAAAAVSPAPAEALILTSEQRVDQAPHSPTDMPPVSHPTMANEMREAVKGAFEEEQRQFLAEESADVHVSTVKTPDRHDALADAWPSRPPEDYYEDEADRDASERADADSGEGEHSEEWVAHDADTERVVSEDVEDTSEAPAPDAPSDERADEFEAEDAVEAGVWIDPAFDEDEALSFKRRGTAEIHQFDPTMTVVEAGWTDDGEIIDASEVEAVDDDEVDDETASDARAEDADTGDADEQVDDTDIDAPPGIAAFLRGNPEDAVRESGQASMFSDDYDASKHGETGEVDLGNLDETTLLDEDALRDMVAEIVREELTGDMGERITRNVRKLVRREIHRALMTREFD